MARKSNDKTKYIKYVFPKDFAQLDSILSVNEDKKTLKLNSDDRFRVHPEYDLSYKLLSMIYSNVKEYRNDSFRKLYSKGNKNENDDLFFHHNRNFEWNDYMFQFPGIYELLGIKRDFHIRVSTKRTDNDSINDKESILEVIQNPILFLFLIDLKIHDDAFFNDDMIELVNCAITAYKEGKESNMFDKKQLEWCYEFLLHDSKYSAFRAWLGDNKVIEIKERVEIVVDDYLKKNNNEEDFNYEEEKGNILSFPKYIRTILLGIYEEYKCLKSFSPLVGNQSLWSKDKVIVFKGIESETSNTFIRFYKFLQYQSESQKLLDWYGDKGMEESDNISMEELDKILTNKIASITEKLINYYTFCIYTLYKVSCEKELDQQLVQDTFERLFSLYLFKNETDLLCEIIDQLAININQNTTEIERINSYFGLTRYVLGMISDEGIHAIYCSPGIAHRVNLVKYIVKTKLLDTLQILYPILEINLIDKVKSDTQILQEINKINQDYFAAEKICIYNWFYEKEELSIKDIKEKYQLNKNCADWNSYNDYYKELHSQIKKTLDTKYEKGSNKKFNHTDASKIAKNIIKNMKHENRIVHFWVIQYSFLSEDSLIKAN